MTKHELHPYYRRTAARAVIQLPPRDPPPLAFIDWLKLIAIAAIIFALGLGL